MKTINEAKETVQKLVDCLESMRLKHKLRKSKDFRKFIKAAKDFIKCNMTNDAIYKKWQVVQDLMKEFSNGTYTESEITE